MAQADLSQLDEKWSRAAKPKPAAASEEPYGDIPDGTYDAVIEEARLTETVSTARPVVIWTLRIQGPQAVNRVVRQNRVITENTLGFLKQDLEKCGLSIARLSELTGRINEMTGRPVVIEKRTANGKVNFYFRWKPKASRSPELEDVPF